MACFSLAFWEQICILIVVAIGIWSIIKLFLPYLTAQLPAIVVQIINIIVWVIIAIICIVIIFGLLSCLIGLGGGLMHFPH